MIESTDSLYRDFLAIKSIKMIPTMLDVVCRITGMGFATVARVTQDRWLACSVLDEVKFGLEEGHELKIETTICNEIRDSHKPVVIDHVAEDPLFKEHHTPKMYGLQSYISYPIILKNGEFFGTLCAIDSKPANVSDPKVTNTFLLFADLISYHLQSVDFMDRSTTALAETERNLNYTEGENQVYKQISDHNLLEQLRKIAVFSGKLNNDSQSNDLDAAKNTAKKINSFSIELMKMVRNIANYSALTSENSEFKKTDLNLLYKELLPGLEEKLAAAEIQINNLGLPVLVVHPSQITELLFHSILFLIDLAPNGAHSQINISTKENPVSEKGFLLPSIDKQKYCSIVIELSQAGKGGTDFKNAFDLFVHNTNETIEEKYGNGLAYCKKIAHNHRGVIELKPGNEKGVVIAITLPFEHESTAAKSDTSKQVEVNS